MSEKIRIDRAELNDPKVDELLSREAVYRGSWGDGGDGEVVGKVKRRDAGRGQGKGVYLHGVALTGFLAMLGALAGWAIVEPFMDDATDTNFFVSCGQMGLIIGLSAGFLSASDGILSRAWGRTLSTSGMGLGIGLVAGLVTSVVANIVYGIGVGIMAVAGLSLSNSRPEQFADNLPLWFTIGVMSIRSAAWCVFGLATGLAPGLLQRSRDLVTVGVLGGVIGGFLGGLVFDPIAALTGGAEASRMIGFGLMGAFTGAAIGLIEQLSKDAWLYMEEGPLVGKQFVLYKDPTKIGSSPKCDIFVFKDPEISPEHAYLRRVGATHEVEAVGGAPVLVNGKRVGRERLEDGDQIRIGKACFRYYVRKKKKKIR